MPTELCGAARTVSYVSFDPIGVFMVNLIVDQTVQEDLSFGAVQFRVPSAASHALPTM
jgi:hypothetical protein